MDSSQLFSSDPELFGLTLELEKTQQAIIVPIGCQAEVPLSQLVFDASCYPEVLSAQKMVNFISENIPKLSLPLIKMMTEKHRLFLFTIETLTVLARSVRYKPLPHHIKSEVVGETIALLLKIQDSVHPMIGVLSALLLSSLTKLGAHAGPHLASTLLSPSFYQSSCLNHFSPHYEGDQEDLLRISSQFNSFTAWVGLTDYHSQCIAHLSTSGTKCEFFQFAKKQLEMNNKTEAINTLESCLSFKWPEVFRLLARLYLDLDPAKSLLFAEQAIALGDIASEPLLAIILGKIPGNSSQISTTRLQLISQLLSKIDPAFAYNVSKSEMLKNSGFINFITAKWKPLPLDVLRTILMSETVSACISLHVSQHTPQAACSSCGFKVCSSACLGEYLLYHPLWCGMEAPKVKFILKKS